MMLPSGISADPFLVESLPKSVSTDQVPLLSVSLISLSLGVASTATHRALPTLVPW